MCFISIKKSINRFDNVIVRLSTQMVDILGYNNNFIIRVCAWQQIILDSFEENIWKMYN